MTETGRTFAIVVGGLVVCLVGCGGPSRVVVPRISALDVSDRALAEWDTSGDGTLDQSEVEACPGLRTAFDLYDANSDGTIGRDELNARWQAMLDSSIGRMPCMITVYLNGQPLPDAAVKLIPEAMFASAIDPATGTTNHRGVAKPVTVDAPPGLPGVQFGIYRVEITHPRRELPARYNTETTLGCELSPLERDGDTMEFRLKG